MPTRTAIAPGRSPGWFAGFGVFPQYEVERVFFGAGHRDTLVLTFRAGGFQGPA